MFYYVSVSVSLNGLCSSDEKEGECGVDQLCGCKALPVASCVYYVHLTESFAQQKGGARQILCSSLAQSLHSKATQSDEFSDNCL